MIDGLKADVVTLALEGDINAIAQQTKKIPANWRTLLPEQFDAVHVDLRIPGAEGKSRRTSGIGTIW